MTRPCCEEKLFEIAGGYDFITDTAIMFQDCTLKVAVGDFPAGTKFGGILVDSEHSLLVLQNFNEDGSLRHEFKFELNYQVGDKIVA